MAAARKGRSLPMYAKIFRAPPKKNLREFLSLPRLPAIFIAVVNSTTMPATKISDAGAMTPKSRKVVIAKIVPNNVTPARSTPLSKSANNVSAAPGTGEKKKKRRGPRSKNKRVEETKVEGLETGSTVVPAAKEPKKKLKQERGPKELSGEVGSTEKDVVVVPRPNWKLSPSLGGQFLQLDPVFAKNEKYRTYNSSENYIG